MISTPPSTGRRPDTSRGAPSRLRPARVLLLVAALGACGGSSTAPAPAEFPGLWFAMSANGQPLPAPVELNGTKEWNLGRGFLNIQPDGSYSGHEVYEPRHVGDGISQIVEFNGTYQADGNTIIMTQSDLRVSYRGTVNGDEMTVAYPWGTYGYVRNQAEQPGSTP